MSEHLAYKKCQPEISEVAAIVVGILWEASEKEWDAARESVERRLKPAIEKLEKCLDTKLEYTRDRVEWLITDRIRRRDLKALMSGCKTFMANFLAEALRASVSSESNPRTVFVEIRMLKDAPPITGSDMKTYGPFRKGRVYAIPKANARVFIKHRLAKATRKEAEKPTLKEMFKGEVLTPYIEAAVAKPLVEEAKLKSEETGKLADVFLELLTKAGVSLPARFKGEFEEAMDINKSYEENVKLIEEAAHRIIKRETEEEYPGAVMERLRKARERAEKLVKEIREARGE